MPSATRQVTPLSLSPGVGPFAGATEVQVTIVGNGSVSMLPDPTYARLGAPITLTAIPDPENYFVRWTGALASPEPSKVFVIRAPAEITARFSDRPDFFSEWRGRFFSPTELADPAISGLEADPDGDGITNAGEYAFGTDPTVFNGRGGFRILPGGRPKQDASLRLEYLRPVYAADIGYILRAREPLGAWSDGNSGDVAFSTVEENVVPQGGDMEKVTLRVSFTGEIPDSLLFQLTANIEEL